MPARVKRSGAVRSWVGVFASAFVLASSIAWADTIYLKDGTVKEGTITGEDDQEVTLEMTISGMKASLHIKQDEIDRIDRTRSPKEALAARESKIEAGDGDGWLKLGKEYKKLGYPDEAERCFEKAIQANPKLEAAAKELELIGGKEGEFSDADTIIKKGQELLDAKQYKEAVEKLAQLLDLPLTKINSVQRKDVLTILIKCFECLGNWAKAQECYDRLIKCPTVDKSEVAVIRVKQRILKDNPDGMIDAGAIEAKSKQAQANLPKLEDLVKAPLDLATAPLKAGAALMAGGKQSEKAGGRRGKEKKDESNKFAKGKKLPLSNPEVMDLVIRAEAEGILLEAQNKMQRADAQAQSDKIWEWTPFPYLAGAVTAMSRPKQITVKSSPADKLYEEAADTADDADYLVPGISAPLLLKVAQKRAGLLDEFIEKTRKEMESSPYYMPAPPPNTPPAQMATMLQQQSTRLQQMNISPEKATEYMDTMQRLDALQSRKLELLQPFSDQILQHVEKVQKDRELTSELRDKAEKIVELADAIKTNEKFEALLAECNVKAKANMPTNFQYSYGYEKYLDASGVYLFKDRGRRWRQQTDLCVSYCEKAMDTGRKRIALLKKFPDRPQFQRDIDVTKSLMVQVYQMEQNVLMDRDRKGRSAYNY